MRPNGSVHPSNKPIRPYSECAASMLYACAYTPRPSPSPSIVHVPYPASKRDVVLCLCFASFCIASVAYRIMLDRRSLIEGISLPLL